VRERHPDLQILPIRTTRVAPAAVRNAALSMLRHLASDIVQKLMAVMRSRLDEARAGLTGDSGP
jgi:hypothetical protein